MCKLVSKNCVDFVKRFEGFYPNRYKCPAGVVTLGYGFTGKEIEGLYSITEPQASKMLEKILNENYAAPIAKDLQKKNINLKQNEFDALVSFAYNCGVQGLFSSTLYKNVCNGIRNPDIITENFSRWNKGGGRVLAGLVRRRKEEAEMFLKDTKKDKKQNNISKYYCSKLQKCWNSSSQTKAPVREDGIIDEDTKEVVNLLLNLIFRGTKEGKKYV